jgi:hypothetical protein
MLREVFAGAGVENPAAPVHVGRHNWSVSSIKPATGSV